MRWKCRCRPHPDPLGHAVDGVVGVLEQLLRPVHAAGEQPLQRRRAGPGGGSGDGTGGDPGGGRGTVEAAHRIVTALRATLVANLLGLPAVAVPAGLYDGRPAGVQLIGPRFGERACLDAAAVVENAIAPITPIDPR